MRRLVLAAITVGLLAVPATAQAAPHIQSYKVRDNGPRIVHMIQWCTGYVEPGYEYKARWNTRVELEHGGDARYGYSVGWYDRGCWITRLSRPDELRYEADYWGRVRLSFKGTTIYTPWRPFSSS